jgi:hypothetical protein
MRGLPFLALAACGCSFTFDGEAPDITVVGGAAPATAGPRPEIGAKEQLWPMRAPDGSWWVLLYTIRPELSTETRSGLTPRPPYEGLEQGILKLRVARLTGEPFEATVDDQQILVLNDRLYHRGPATVTTWRPGEPWPGATWPAPLGANSWLVAEGAFALWGGGTIATFRTDGTHRRTFTKELPLLFARRGDLLITVRACDAGAMQPCTHVVVHSTADDGDVEVEVKATVGIGSVTLVDEDRVVLCDAQGLYSFHFDGQVFGTDHAPCNVNTAVGVPRGILLCNADGLRRVRLTNGMQDMIDPTPCDGALFPLGRPPAWSVTRPDDETNFVCTPLGLVAAPADGSLPRLLGDCTIHRPPLDRASGPLGALLDDAMLLCDEAGLRRVPFDGGAPSTIDSERCNLLRSGEWLTDHPPRLVHGDVWYARDYQTPWPDRLTRDVLAAPLDGSAAPRVALSAVGERYLLPIAAATTASPLYAQAPPGPKELIRGSNGWLDDWQFMERGILATSSADGRRVRWIEHAAKLDPVGELMSAAVPGGVPLRLARNAVQYEEIAPGKLLVADDQALVGPQNRVLLIDEGRREARRLADAAMQFHKLADDSLLVELVSDGDRRSLAVVPLVFDVR